MVRWNKIRWRKGVKVCYFLLIFMVAIVVAYPSLFNQTILNVSIARIYWAALIIIIGVIDNYGLAEL